MKLFKNDVDKMEVLETIGAAADNVKLGGMIVAAVGFVAKRNPVVPIIATGICFGGIITEKVTDAIWMKKSDDLFQDECNEENCDDFNECHNDPNFDCPNSSPFEEMADEMNEAEEFSASGDVIENPDLTKNDENPEA